MAPATSMRRKRIAAVIILLLMIAAAGNHFLDLGLLGELGKLGMVLVGILAVVFGITNIPTQEEFDSVRKRRAK